MLGLSLAASLGVIIVCSIQKNPSEKWLKISSATSILLIILASLYLWLLILNDSFEIAYIASYSSKELPTVYKISAFWAGQQGSFLLWLLFHAIAGFFLLRQKVLYSTLKIYYALQIFLIILVLAKSPFVPSEITVIDGVGLNPLLQDPWMAIHPPIIFLGYALLAVPFSLSLGNLITEPATRNFLENARRWTLIAWAFLGAGIFVGGYWAYKVLGWGGYWGWDPVENSSLVPWLLSAVLLHLINLSKSKPAVVAITHVAAIFTYSLVIYGTFLTRSGILGDFSVHSFSNSNIGVIIAIINALVLIGGLLILMQKSQYLPKGKMYENFSERAFFILLGSLILVFIAVIVWISMSMPLLTSLMEKPAAVDTNFYVKTTSPLALTIFILLIIIFTKFKLKSINLGGIVAHVGILSGLLAIILSSSGSNVSQELTPNIENDLVGHKIIYEGQEFSESGKEKFYIYNVDGEIVKALTKLRANGEDAAREPAILKTLTGDVYIAPSPQNLNVEEFILEHKKFTLKNDLAYIFKESEIERDWTGEPTLVKVKISITDGNLVEDIEPTIKITAVGGNSEPISFFNDTKRIRLTGISGDEQKIRVEVMPSLEELSSMPITATISTKPFIWLLWLSAITIFLGTLIAVKK